MKKLITTVALVVLGTSLSFGAVHPNCSSIGDIIQVLESEGIRDVTSMTLQKDKWVVRHGGNGSMVKQIQVQCTPDHLKGHVLAKYHHTAPPSEESMDVAQITTKALNEEEGIVTKAEFIDSSWFVTVTDGTADTELQYNPVGKLMYKIYTD